MSGGSLLAPQLSAEKFLVPVNATAELPKRYIAARIALQALESVDECQDWANKSAAMASYARQANDPALRQMADRIQARAVRRCGELLHTLGRNPGGMAADRFPRKMEIAKEAGLNLKQYTTAMAVANIQENTFEELIESEDPPKLYKLAEYGVRKRAGGGHGSGRRKGSLHYKEITSFIAFVEAHPPTSMRETCCQHSQLEQIQRWCIEILGDKKWRVRT